MAASRSGYRFRRNFCGGLLLALPLSFCLGNRLQAADAVRPAPDLRGAAKATAVAGRGRSRPTLAERIVSRLNRFRRQERLHPVETSKQLNSTAQDFAKYMAETGQFDHLADGRTPDARVEVHGYQYCVVGENIASYWREASLTDSELSAQVITQWKESPGHRQTMLTPYYTEVGIGVARSPSTGEYYAVQVFGRPRRLEIKFDVDNQSGETVYYALGNDSVTLEADTRTTHTLSIPVELEFFGSSAPTEEAPRPKAVSRLSPETGDRLIVRRTTRGELVLKRAAQTAQAKGGSEKSNSAKPDSLQSSH